MLCLCVVVPLQYVSGPSGSQDGDLYTMLIQQGCTYSQSCCAYLQDMYIDVVLIVMTFWRQGEIVVG